MNIGIPTGKVIFEKLTLKPEKKEPWYLIGFYFYMFICCLVWGFLSYDPVKVILGFLGMYLFGCAIGWYVNMKLGEKKEVPRI